MYIQVCDRCGRETDLKPAFLLPVDAREGTYQLNGVWFGRPIVLCDDCLKEFEDFRYNHKSFELKWVEKND